MRIVHPDEFVPANPVIAGSEEPDDISASWYIVARGGNEEIITIDCAPDRLGRCYDSFWARHAIAGSCRVVALSFTELVRRLYAASGKHWYWLSEGAPDHGDAYEPNASHDTP